MTFPKPRNDVFARFEGRDYRSTRAMPDGTVLLIHDGAEAPGDERFSKYGDHDAWVLRVPATACERLAQVSTVARYRMSEVQVEDVTEDGLASLYFMRHLLGTAGPPEGFEQVGKWEFRAQVPVRELRDYHENHVDLLFDLWRTSAYGAASGGRR